MKIFRFKWVQFIAFLGFLNFTILATSATILTEAKSALLDWVCRHIFFPRWLCEIFLFVVVNITFIVLWIVIQFIKARLNGTMKISVDDDSDGRRIEEFQRLRAQAKKDILIMGIGLSEVSKDINRIEELLGKGKNITFLIMDPDVLVESPQTAIINDSVELSQTTLNNLTQQFQTTRITIDDNKFSEFYSTRNYREIIKTSINNLQNLVERQKKRRSDCHVNWHEGQIQVKKYPYYVPLNVTISDMDEPFSKLIVEFCLPFSTKRIRAKFSHGKVKKLIETQIKELLQSANPI